MFGTAASSVPPTTIDGVQLASSKVVGRLKLYFALLACLGGIVLGAGSDTETLPVIAVFFALFGYVFVDKLQLFALPPIAAYASMGLAALYCVSDFVDLDAPGNHQMAAVAQLLVFVQSILMLQKKTRRIFEQLGVFCLLELIVAAVFNNAINYGLWLIPISLIGAWALSLLAAVSATEGLDPACGLQADDEPSVFSRRVKPSTVITASALESTGSLATAALRLPRIAMLTLAPSVLLVGAIFFYALPRTTDAARIHNRGNAIVGFDDDLHMEQIGQMMQSTQVAMRVRLQDRESGLPHVLPGGLYLRGRVLERYTARYHSEKNSATWTALPVSLMTGIQPLPREYHPPRNTDKNFYDDITVKVICESMRSSALFAIAPYHRVVRDNEIVHHLDRWVIARRSSNELVYPRTTYTFGTHAFRGTLQTDLIARWSVDGLPGDVRQGMDLQQAQRLAAIEKDAEDYVDDLLQFNIDAMPTAASLAGRFTQSASGQRPNDYSIAKAMERFLATDETFQYTLNLNAPSLPGLDPVEQFLSVDRRGHCQYFASALAMMLRSVGIPSRVVVGYHTDEFNELGGHYTARQLHAHAWVEALIASDQLDPNRTVYGQPPAKQYWLRLDPTPSAGRMRATGNGVNQVMDIAQTMWDDYVVDMDAKRQENSLLGGASITPLNRSYEGLVDTLSQAIASLRAGQLGGGALARGDFFSWPAAIAGILFTVFFAIVLRIRLPQWIRQHTRRDAAVGVMRPTIDFYAQTLDQLARLGVTRAAAQTPAELVLSASTVLPFEAVPPIAGPLQRLTDAFYRLRFGSTATSIVGDSGASAEAISNQQAEIEAALAELTRNVDLMTAAGLEAEQAT